MRHCPRHTRTAAAFMFFTSLVVSCSSGGMAPDERNVSLDDLEEPSYYTSEGLYTFARSESLVVVHFVEGLSDDAEAAELAAHEFTVVQRIQLGRSPRLTIARADAMARHFHLLRGSSLIDWATPVLLNHAGRPRYPFNQISMAFVDGVSVQEREAKITAFGGTILENSREAAYRVEIPWSRADSVFTLARRMDEDPLVLYATPRMYFTFSVWD